MLKPHRYFTLSILLCGAMSLWACTSGQVAGAGGSLPAGGTGGNGGKGGSGGLGGGGGAVGHVGAGGATYVTDYTCNWTASASPCGGTTAVGGSTGAGGTMGTGGTPVRDAAVEVGTVDVPSSEAMLDRGVTETSTGVVDSALVDSTGIDSDGVLRGYQVYGNELMAFEPCGSSELIWMNLSGWEKGLDLIPAQTCPGDASLAMCVRHMYTELTGVISPEGKYGHLSKYSRQLTVQEFLLVTLAESPTCPFVSPVFPN